MSTHDFSALSGIPSAGVHPRLFCLEAGDKVGKSTLADNLVPWLGSRGHEARVFREPGGSPRAEELRRILKDPGNGLTPAQAADLFFEAREDLLRTTLLPWLAADTGRIAILDRYFWSTIVYQGVMGGQDMGRLAGMIIRVCQGAIPARTFMLDLDPAVAHARAAADGGAKAADVDAGDLMSPADKARLRAGYSALAARFPGLITRVDADQSRAQLADQVGAMILAAIR